MQGLYYVYSSEANCVLTGIGYNVTERVQRIIDDLEGGRFHSQEIQEAWDTNYRDFTFEIKVQKNTWDGLLAQLPQGVRSFLHVDRFYWEQGQNGTQQEAEKKRGQFKPGNPAKVADEVFAKLGPQSLTQKALRDAGLGSGAAYYHYTRLMGQRQ